MKRKMTMRKPVRVKIRDNQDREWEKKRIGIFKN